MNKLKKQRASTLVEVLVAVAVISTVITAIMAMLAMSVKVAESNEKRQLALQKGNEMTEYLRKERLITSWPNFNSQFTEATYCLINFPNSLSEIVDEIGTCSDEQYFTAAGYDFQRELIVTNNGTDVLSMQVVVRWEDAGLDKELVLNQEFREY